MAKLQIIPGLSRKLTRKEQKCYEYRICKLQDCTRKNPTKKIEHIARICNKVKGEVDENSDVKTVKDLISGGHTNLLEHADVMVSVSENVYERVRDQLHRKETQIGKNDKSERCRLRFSETSTSDRYPKGYSYKRFLISGNLRAWYEYFEWLGDYGDATDGTLFDMVYSAANNIFSEFTDDIISVPRQTIVRRLDMTEISPEERMVHERFTVIFTTDRNIVNELINTHEASITQALEDEQSPWEITVISPVYQNEHRYDIWRDACRYAESKYIDLLNAGTAHQNARDVLPMSLKSEIVITASLNEWRRIFIHNACDTAVHPQMRRIMCSLLAEQQVIRPFAFDDLKMSE